MSTKELMMIQAALRGFTDMLETAYGTCLYYQWGDEESQKVHTTLIHYSLYITEQIRRREDNEYDF